jgi:hypothetical protein
MGVGWIIRTGLTGNGKLLKGADGEEDS